MKNNPYFPDKPVFIVDDEKLLIESYKMTLIDIGINNIISTTDSRNVLSIIKNREIQLLLLDLSMPHVSGKELLEIINHDYPQIPVIVITGNHEIDTAVECMKLGAFDYLTKPISEGRLISCVKRAVEIRNLRSENAKLKNKIISTNLTHPEAFSEIITQNEQMRSIFKYMEAIAKTSEPILITGETGVGKELIAKSLHKLSGKKGKFVSTNVAGLDDQMFSDTLFGHKRGAFTNANSDRIGLIERAKHGTIFLDEIGDLSGTSQIKLLRLLQEKEYYPLGSDEPKYSDALVIAATNKNLFELKENGEFRNDLYYRLNVHHINPIPLRERLDDLPLLIEYFLEKAAIAFNKKIPTYPKELVQLLSTYHFPGNIRELQSMIYNAVSVHQSGILSLNSFYEVIDGKKKSQQKPNKEFNSGQISFSYKLPTIKEATTALIKEALTRANNNQSIAARMLGITRQALNKRLTTSLRKEFTNKFL